MKRMQIQFTAEQEARLRRAARDGRSIAAIVREAVDAYLADETALTRRDAALEAVGGFRSAAADVSERHDDYLAEDFR